MVPAPEKSPQTAIPVFFSTAMQAKVESLSPSAHKPLAAVESWKALGIPLSIIAPTPVTRGELARAHDRGLSTQSSNAARKMDFIPRLRT
ncbi:MAG TPA: hypothetical protein VMV25_09690 [Steroidobacteraceae bacterium]|nr:hypothetical protein [Steroidobacteraceae bacterium]